MQIVLLLPVLFMVAGGGLYLWLRNNTTYAGVAELGRLAFWAGAFVFLMQSGPDVVSLVD